VVGAAVVVNPRRRSKSTTAVMAIVITILMFTVKLSLIGKSFELNTSSTIFN
jgi:hypothetical protein